MKNNDKNIFAINCRALASAKRIVGKPDLVITDYESVSAQYAYASGSPLITIDQQSKFLCGDFPKKLGAFDFQDEVERLQMFFPKAAARIACSFFTFPFRANGEDVCVVPPTIRDRVAQIRRKPKKNTILVYISSARTFKQKTMEMIRIFSAHRSTEFHLFCRATPSEIRYAQATPNIRVYPSGDPAFERIMTECTGIICTAGHTLLSEALFLGIPVYAIPVAPYEQHLNAHVIADNGFGVSHQAIQVNDLRHFIEQTPVFAETIRSDKKILLRGLGQDRIINTINSYLNT